MRAVLLPVEEEKSSQPMPSVDALDFPKLAIAPSRHFCS